MGKYGSTMFKKWFIVIVSTCGVILFLQLPVWNITSLSFSITLNFLLMLWISIVEPILKPPLDSPLFNSFPFEKEGEIYKYLGVQFYRKLLVKSGWERKRKKEAPIRKSLDSLRFYEYKTRGSEFGHGIIAIIVMAITIYVCITYSVIEGMWLIATNVLLNVYPMIVQRYNRPRIRKVIKKLEGYSTHKK